MLQELNAFLTVEGSLADSYQWRQLQPLQGSVLEGIARLPKQLLGGSRHLPTCTEVKQVLLTFASLEPYRDAFKGRQTSVKASLSSMVAMCEDACMLQPWCWSCQRLASAF